MANPRTLIAAMILVLIVTVIAPANPATTRAAPEVIQSDDALTVTFGPEQRILPGGLQPSLVCTRTGTLIVQAQVPRKPAPTTRISYFSALDTVVSRDGGKTW